MLHENILAKNACPVSGFDNIIYFASAFQLSAKPEPALFDSQLA